MNRFLNDNTLDMQAKAYSRQHKVSYTQALIAIQEIAQGMLPSFAEPATQGASDAHIDMAATAYAKAHSVSYSEALNCVVIDGGVASFAEAEPGSAAESMSRQQIEIFRSGDHIDDKGVTHKFSAADLAGMAASYNPSRAEAPLTLGHPESNKPAFGWVKSLQATPDGRLMMLAGNIQPAFADAIKDGSYKKRSASFYPPNAPTNPVPGVWYLRHVGWLGAQAPAIKGLADVSFAAQAGCEFVSF